MAPESSSTRVRLGDLVRAHRAETVWIAVAIAAGVAIRVWLIVLPTGAFDSDEAVVGLIARHALYHREFHTFYWGQAYGGTLEPLLAAPLFAVAGARIGVLKAVPLLLSALTAVLVWRVGRRTVGNRAGVIAACAFFVWPANYVWLSTKERGFYWVCMVLGLLLFLCVLRLRDEPKDVRFWLLLGLLGGAGIWTSPQILFFVVPAMVWLLLGVRADAWRIVWSIPTGVIGGLPWLVFNVRNGFASLLNPPYPADLGYWGNAKVLVTRGVPVALGMNAGERWILSAPLMKTVYVLVVVGTAIAVARRRRGTGLLVVNVAAFALLWGIYPVSGVVGEGRYVMFVLPSLALLIAHAAGNVPARTLLLAAVIALSVLGVNRIRHISEPRAPDVLMPHHVGPLVAFLEDRHIDRVFANYWVAYRLAFESKERVIATPADSFARYEPYVDTVSSARRPAFVFPSTSGQVRLFQGGLDRLGVATDRFTAGDFTVFVPHRKVGWFEVFNAP